MTYGEPNRGTHAWTLGEAESRPFIQRALELGITFFDTANTYSAGSSEEILGRALKDFAKREEVIVATKVFFNEGGLSKDAIMREIDASLQRLQMDYVDLYQIHRWDYDMPIEETLEALDQVVKSGKAKAIGASSMYAWQFSKALYLAQLKGWTQFSTMQNHYNLLYREEEREMLPLCSDQRIGVIPWSPLARGRLARDRNESTERAETDEFCKRLYVPSDRVIVERVGELASRRGVPRAQVALAWLFAKPEITAPIIGASKPHHLEDAVAALELKLSPDEITFLEEAYEPHRVAGFS